MCHAACEGYYLWDFPMGPNPASAGSKGDCDAQAQASSGPQVSPMPLPMVSPGAAPSPQGGAPISGPHPSPGATAAAYSKIQAAAKILQEAYSGLDPMGEEAASVLKSIQTLTKIAPPSQASQGVGQETLRNLLQQAQQHQMMGMIQQRAQPPQAPQGAPPPGA